MASKDSLNMLDDVHSIYNEGKTVVLWRKFRSDVVDGCEIALISTKLVPPLTDLAFDNSHLCLAFLNLERKKETPKNQKDLEIYQTNPKAAVRENQGLWVILVSSKLNE